MGWEFGCSPVTNSRWCRGGSAELPGYGTSAPKVEWKIPSFVGTIKAPLLYYCRINCNALGFQTAASRHLQQRPLRWFSRR